MLSPKTKMSSEVPAEGLASKDGHESCRGFHPSRLAALAPQGDGALIGAAILPDRNPGLTMGNPVHAPLA